jgi:magnesium chelatase subunit ChlI-like protein
MASPLSSGPKPPTDAQRYADMHPRLDPCPCGYFGDLKRECRCSPVQVQRYRQRISGPLLDRIDLHIEVPAVEYRDVSSERTKENSTAIRERIARNCSGQAKTARALRARRKNKLQCAHDYAAFENALQTKRRFSGADPHRDERAEPESARLRSNPESLADHRRFGRQDRHHAGAHKRSDSISHVRSNALNLGDIIESD